MILGSYLILALINIQYSDELEFKEVYYQRIKGKEGTGLNVSVEGHVAYGATIKINCLPFSDFNNKTEIIWKKDGNIIFRGRTLVIKTFQKQSFGKYFCEMQTKEAGIKNGSIDLTPEKDLKTKIDMIPTPGRFYNFSLGKTKQLYCHLPKEETGKRFKSNNIIWTFRGISVDTFNRMSKFRSSKRFVRHDRRSVSILVLKDMDLDNEGTYKCFQNLSVFTAHMIWERDISVDVTPDVQTLTDNANETVEFICQINTLGLTSKFIKWSFKPKDSDKEEALPKEAKEENSGTLSMSYLVIENVGKKHEGIYVCHVLEKKVFGRLIVESKIDSGQNLINQSKKEMIKSMEERQKINKELNLKESQINQLRKQMNELRKEMNELRKEMNESIIERKNIKREMNEFILERIKFKKERKMKEIKMKELRRDFEIMKNNRRNDILKIQEIKEELRKEKAEKERQNTQIKFLKIASEEGKYMNEKRDQKMNILEFSFPNLFLKEKLKVDFVGRFDRISEQIHKELYSKPFISNKYRLSLYLVVINDGRVGLGYIILKGDNDDKLEWPLKRTMTVSLLDQESFNSVETLTFKYDTYKHKEAFDKPKADKNIYHAWGYLSLKYTLLKDRPSVLTRDSLLISGVLS